MNKVNETFANLVVLAFFICMVATGLVSMTTGVMALFCGLVAMASGVYCFYYLVNCTVELDEFYGVYDNQN